MDEHAQALVAVFALGASTAVWAYVLTNELARVTCPRCGGSGKSPTTITKNRYVVRGGDDYLCEGQGWVGTTHTLAPLKVYSVRKRSWEHK